MTDQGGALVKGATVDVISEQTGRSVRTVTAGETAASRPRCYRPGTYSLEVTAANFKKAVCQGVQVRHYGNDAAGRRCSKSGSIEETVNVEATPSLINPSSAQHRPGPRLANSEISSAGVTQLPVPALSFLRGFRRADRRAHRWTRNRRREC